MTICRASLVRTKSAAIFNRFAAGNLSVCERMGKDRHIRRLYCRTWGRRKHPDLKPSQGLQVGIVQKIQDAAGNLLRVKRQRLFGRRGDILKLLKRLKLGRQINTVHIERLKGTLRTQQTRLARRTRSVSHAAWALERALWLWRDLSHWTRPDESLADHTSAMAIGLATKLWTVRDYVWHPVHVGNWQRALWAEQRERLLTNGLNRQNPRKRLPIS